MDFQVRKLKFRDLRNGSGFLETLTNLSEVGKTTLLKRCWIFFKIRLTSHMFVAVPKILEYEGQVIGVIKLMIEPKFYHSGGRAGHIEDVVTREGFEGNGVGSALLRVALEKAREEGVYKVVLSASEKVEDFYKKHGFVNFEKTLRMNLR